MSPADWSLLDARRWASLALRVHERGSTSFPAAPGRAAPSRIRRSCLPNRTENLAILASSTRYLKLMGAQPERVSVGRASACQHATSCEERADGAVGPPASFVAFDRSPEPPANEATKEVTRGQRPLHSFCFRQCRRRGHQSSGYW